jgi:hypothetical protein
MILHLAVHAQIQEGQIAQGPHGRLALGDGPLPIIQV